MELRSLDSLIQGGYGFQGKSVAKGGKTYHPWIFIIAKRIPENILM